MPSILKICCEPGSNILEAMHTFVTAYARARYRPLIAERVGVASYELMSNGLNYGSVSSEITFELLQEPGRVSVVVVNDAIPSRIRVLSAHVSKLTSGAEAVYLDEMKRSLAGGVPRAMLGLARLVHEAQMKVSVLVHGEHRVSVSASCAV